jgi:LmbE family N-acetylglucosaminyl deacetylase
VGEYDFKSAEICRQLLTRRARDITQSTASASALVIAPHPDDETFGCGATIARKAAAGTSVSVCVVSDGGAFPTDEMSPEALVSMREDNFAEACGILGVPQDNVSLLGFPDRGIESDGRDVVAAISEVIDRVQPDEIFLPTRHDVHPDHKTVNRLSYEAVARSTFRPAVYAYPVWFWARDTWTPRNASRVTELASRFRFLAAGVTLRSVRVDAGPFLDAKRRAMECYAWELKPDREFFEHWALSSEELFFAAGGTGRTQP